jgi:hypothetical protein
VIRRSLLSAVLAVSAFAEPKASFEDLQAMAANASWEELLERAEDVPAARRTDEWRSLVTKAATAVVERDEARAAALSTRYRFLADAPGFSRVNGSAAVTTLETCLRDDKPKDPLTTCVTAFKKSKPNGEALAAGARVIRRSWNPAAPLDLWTDAVSANKGLCKDAQLQESVMAGLELPKAEARAGLARTLAFETCWAAMQSVVKPAMVHASTYLLSNACDPLRAKKALTELQSELCKDQDD